MSDKPLTQRALIAQLREDLDLHVGPATVHRLIRAGMPTVTVGKKPRFHYPTCRAWILASRESDPVVQGARDRLFRRAMRRGA